MRISVLGAGSWGSALACAFSKIAPVLLWSRDQAQVFSIQTRRVNHGYLPDDVIFPDSITVTSDFSSACNTDLIVIATPLNAVREVLAAISREAKEIPDIILVSKGFEANSGKLSHEIIHDVLPEFKRFGLLLGPSFAKEVALELPTAITLAAFDLSFAISWMQKLKGIPNFRIYAHDDIIGSEVGSAVKNVLAIAVGISDGMQLGFNARAALITRSLNELAALVLALGGRRETIYGLTGIGDLILTCTGDLSRNRQVGLELAKGKSIDAIVNELGHVAEGVLTAKEIHLKAQSLGIDMPIVASVYRIIYENSDIKSEVVNLIARAQKTEFI